MEMNTTAEREKEKKKTTKCEGWSRYGLDRFNN